MNTFHLMRAHYLILAFAALVLFGCGKESEKLQTESLSDYLPLQPGKYITYRVDSTIFTNFGTVTVVHSYQEKNQVDSLTTDNLGRPSYRVFRYLRDIAGTQAWKPLGSYYITQTKNTIEVIENNLRMVKLTLPIQKNFSWKGNGYLPTDPFASSFGSDWSLDNGMVDWNYQYTTLAESLQFNGQTVNNVITVKQIDDSTNVPVTLPQSYGYITRALDKYAKGIGNVYQELTMWEYQPATAYKVGFGVKRSMIDHN